MILHSRFVRGKKNFSNDVMIDVRDSLKAYIRSNTIVCTLLTA